MKRTLVVAFVMATILVAEASARGRGVIVVGPRYAPYGGFGWYGGGWGPGMGWGPGWGPYMGGPATGRIKFDTPVRDAEVLIDGAYAGTVASLKTLSIKPGSYSIELRAPGRSRYAEKVYVIAGKTLTLRPDLAIRP